MRIILYLGKGGVGKTTIAAASALRSAQLGFRTLVVSTDIAHSLADSLDTPLESKPIEVAPNLYAQEINVLDEVREHWGELQAYVGSMLRRQGMSKAIAEEMAIIPGMEEIVSLLHINKHAKDGDFDRIIIDAAPTGETMRLLTMPDSFHWYVERFLGAGDATMRLATGILRRMMPAKDPLNSLNNLVDGVKELQQVLIDPAITSYRVVLNPEKMVIKEGARAITYLSLYGYPVDAAIVNRILPGIKVEAAENGETVHTGRIGKVTVSEPSVDPYLRTFQETQARYLMEIERDFYPLPILCANWTQQEMVGLERLEMLGKSLFSEQDPGDVYFVGQTQKIEEQGEDFVLKLPLPSVELDKVKLTKRGDELFVSIGNFKRELLLPAVLTHRSASNAVFTDGILQVRFPPAPFQPTHLSAVS
ncbi:ArsA family ATPase [Chloroflexi bacterium TSY]|nr:ArsA family ATPase [Chloroflexi bacterium TSY]